MAATHVLVIMVGLLWESGSDPGYSISARAFAQAIRRDCGMNCSRTRHERSVTVGDGVRFGEYRADRLPLLDAFAGSRDVRDRRIGQPRARVARIRALARKHDRLAEGMPASTRGGEIE